MNTSEITNAQLSAVQQTLVGSLNSKSIENTVVKALATIIHLNEAEIAALKELRTSDAKTIADYKERIKQLEEDAQSWLDMKRDTNKRNIELRQEINKLEFDNSNLKEKLESSYKTTLFYQKKIAELEGDTGE
jgi:predicted nuclease with TOPRIM domain